MISIAFFGDSAPDAKTHQSDFLDAAQSRRRSMHKANRSDLWPFSNTTDEVSGFGIIFDIASFVIASISAILFRNCL